MQGSGIGPTLYIVMKHDLRTISELNDLFKFADDTTLLVPQNTDVDLSLEFQHIKNWAADNRLIINVSKTKEIVLHRPRARYFSVPVPVDGVDQVACCKLLGVLFQNNFKMEEHVNFLLTQCSQRLYILKQLQNQGMTASQIQTVAQALIVSRLLYALPAWGSFVSAAQINKIDAFLRHLKRYGYVTRDYCMADLMHSSDYELFRKSLKPGHCLHDLLPVAKNTLLLRPRGHDFMLPYCVNNLHKQSFIVRSLYNFV